MPDRKSKQRLTVDCGECLTTVTGGQDGTTDGELIVKLMNEHDEGVHGARVPNTHKRVLNVLTFLNDGTITLPMTSGRYIPRRFSN